MGTIDYAWLHEEITCVREALQSGSTFLGMHSHLLQEYSRQLSEKDRLLMLIASHQKQNGHGDSSSSASAGPVDDFDRSALPSVIEHLYKYEANPRECAKALKALSGLAYSATKKVAADERVLQRLLRLLDLHEDKAVRLAVMQVLCNLAYDNDMAQGSLATEAVLAGLLGALVPDASGDLLVLKHIASKASEALARIISAGEGIDDNGKANIPARKPSPLTKLFATIVGRGDSSCASRVREICARLTANEVVDCATIATALTHDISAAAAKESARTAIAWFELTKALAGDKEQSTEEQTALIRAGAIEQALQLMDKHLHEEPVQVAGIEAMSAMVGVVWDALEVFARSAGVRQIEAALREHTGSALLQLRGLRALGSGVGWPTDLQVKSGYSWRSTLELTLAAMRQHPKDADLQLAGMDAIVKIVQEHPSCLPDLKSEGIEEMIQGAMAQHPQAARLHTLSGAVLQLLQSRK
eukprot:TRINITY_DN17578_c0_g1_i4.p1 TRINITY_DN17578_c0_g1~~TRINITY_DN17578_c0_g1_i4.p1  ORF type:complete len:473 (-),score=117.02 TRINITY_DN17578_c0_g1_i4:178-1596(-)